MKKKRLLQHSLQTWQENFKTCEIVYFEQSAFEDRFPTMPFFCIRELLNRVRGKLSFREVKLKKYRRLYLAEIQGIVAWRHDET